MGVKTAREPRALDTATEDVAVDVFEVAGTIKWFDVGKGYGFIVPDNGEGDILLHVTCLRRDGYQTAYEGARVVCEVLDRPRGLQAFRILSMDETTATHPSQLPPSRTHVQVVPEGGFEKATVKWFNRVKGFGFLTQGEGHRRHFHSHGNTAPVRDYGIASWPGCDGALRRGPERPDGRRNPANGSRDPHPGVALAAPAHSSLLCGRT